MSNQYGHAQIVTDGLAFSVDAGDATSYPGSGTTWYDLSKNGYDGTIDGATFSTDGNGSLDFNGSSNDVDLGSQKVLKYDGGWTIESWVKADAVSGGPYNFTGGSYPDDVGWYWCVLSSKLAIWNISPGVWKYGSTTLSTGVWMHCVCVSENAGGTSYQFYLNGVAEGGSHASYVFYGGGDDKSLELQFIGSGHGAGGTWPRLWNGKYAINRCYTQALTPDQIKQNFNAQRSRFGI